MYPMGSECRPGVWTEHEPFPGKLGARFIRHQFLPTGFDLSCEFPPFPGCKELVFGFNILWTLETLNETRGIRNTHSHVSHKQHLWFV